MKVIYRADDGTDFITQEDCVRYEQGHLLRDFIAKNIPRDYDEEAGKLSDVVSLDKIEKFIIEFRNEIKEILFKMKVI